MNMKEKYSLLRKPVYDSDKYQEISAKDAGWEFLNFAARKMGKNEKWEHETDGNEYGIVILGGKCSIKTTENEWKNLGNRENVFKGMPTAIYLPRNTEFSIVTESEELDIAYAWVASDEDHPVRLIKPEDASIEIRGGGNATRQINSIMPPGFDCQKLVCVEVYTPAGNWSSYPPHKHDVHKVDKEGNILEADLEEVYFYKIDNPKGFAVQRVYSSDKKLDEVMVAENNDLILVPEGYHPVAAGHGYNVYYLNFLAGSAQSLMSSDDPEHAWIKKTWKSKEPRVPILKLNM